MNPSYEINGLMLPAALVSAIEEGRWRTPELIEVWLSLFPRSEVVRPELYSLAEMQSENAYWSTETDPEYLGVPESAGAIDPAKSLLIGELQPDVPVALDYRKSLDNPRVLYLPPTGVEARWKEVAPNIMEFMRVLSL